MDGVSHLPLAKLGQTRGAQRVVGVDIDDTLIRAAWKRRRAVWSMQGPLATSQSDPQVDDEPSPKKRKRQNEDGGSAEQCSAADYFPASCEHIFGSLPIPGKAEGSAEFPHNVVFFNADWVDSEIAEDTVGYDVVLA